MATINYTVTPDRYTKVSDRDCLVQNLSPYTIRVVFSDIHPNSDTEDYIEVNPENINFGTNEHKIYKFNNFPSGNVYVKCGAPVLSGKESKIAVVVSDLQSNPNEEILIELRSILNQLRLMNTRIESAFNTKITERDLGC